MSAIAICCGFNGYRTAPLMTAVADAAGLFKVLSEEPMFHRDNTAFQLSRPITNDDATASQILTALSAAMAKAKLVWFSFSGHGLLHEGELHLLLPGWSPSQTGDYTIRASEIEGILRANRDKRFVVVLDACHAGAFGGTPQLSRTRDVLHHPGDLVVGTGGVVMSACSQDELALDGNPRAGLLNGVFTRHLLKVLEERRNRKHRLGAIELFFEASRAMRAADARQIPTIYANGVTEEITILEGSSETLGFVQDVPPQIRNELAHFLESMRIIVRDGRVGLRAAERDLEKLAHKFYQCRLPSFIVDDFEAHVSEAYENATRAVIACTTPRYFDEWRDNGVAKSLVLANESFIQNKGGRVIRFYFADGDFRRRYPELRNVLRDHLERRVEAYVVSLDAYRHSVLPQLFPRGDDLDRLECAFVDGKTYLRTRFEERGIRIEVNQDATQCRIEYTTWLRPFLDHFQPGLYKPVVDRNDPLEIDWGPPLSQRQVATLRDEIDFIFDG